MTLKDWPPNYCIRLSKRVKTPHWRFTLEKGLEFVTRRKISTKEIQTLLHTHRVWIEKIISKYGFSHSLEKVLPVEVNFPAFNGHWKIIHLEKGLLNYHRLSDNEQTLFLSCHKNQLEVGKKLLLKWLHKKSIDLLSPLLLEISKTMNVSFSQLVFRHANSIWGSCDKNKKIMLSTRLLFLPITLIRYVMIHELSHLVYLNHSNYFWQLVAQHDPNYRFHRLALKKCQQYLPSWLYLV